MLKGGSRKVKPMAINKKLMTVTEFEAFADAPENADRRLELINGEIVEKVPAEEHGIVVANVGTAIKIFVKANQLGGRVGVEIRHKIPLDAHNARMPDVAYTSAERVLPLVRKGSIPQMPDLAVEVQSPDDTVEELRAKAAYYLQQGSRLVWLAYPPNQTVESCTWDGEQLIIDRLGPDDELTGGEVLPGFAVRVAELFELG